jgi:hypothetical protein
MPVLMWCLRNALTLGAFFHAHLLGHFVQNVINHWRHIWSELLKGGQVARKHA